MTVYQLDLEMKPLSSEIKFEIKENNPTRRIIYLGPDGEPLYTLQMSVSAILAFERIKDEKKRRNWIKKHAKNVSTPQSDVVTLLLAAAEEIVESIGAKVKEEAED